MIKSVGNVEEDVTFRPIPVCAIDQLNLIEKNLQTMPEPFVEEYKKMIEYYRSTIRIPSKNFKPQNGYMHSLMSMYLEREFAKSFIWKSAKQQAGFDVFENHIKFFKDICNKVEIKPGTKMFANLTEAEISVQAFFKSIHQTPRAPKLNTLNVEEEGGEGNVEGN
ncbi:hypothetical protein ACKWTF_016555 [Chironomus riparius]